MNYQLTNDFCSPEQNGRIRYWAVIREKAKYLRVVTEPDGETVHNAFFDRGFKHDVEEGET